MKISLIPIILFDIFPQNLLARAPSSNVPSMLVAKVLPFVESLSQRKWGDDEIIEDLAFVKDDLKTRLRDVT